MALPQHVIEQRGTARTLLDYLFQDGVLDNHPLKPMVAATLAPVPDTATLTAEQHALFVVIASANRNGNHHKVVPDNPSAAVEESLVQARVCKIIPHVQGTRILHLLLVPTELGEKMYRRWLAAGRPEMGEE